MLFHHTVGLGSDKEKGYFLPGGQTHGIPTVSAAY